MSISDLPGLSGKRRVALLEDAFWKPLKGAVEKIAVEMELNEESAAELLQVGIPAGTIAHRVRPGPDETTFLAVANPQGAALIKRGGFNYDTDLIWRTGSIFIPGAASAPLEIFWPDVKLAAQSQPAKKQAVKKMTQAEITAWMANYYRAAKAAGKKPPKREHEAFPDCKEATGATDRQMRVAMDSVPFGLKNTRGRLPR